jgi:hypothetical protein
LANADCRGQVIHDIDVCQSFSQDVGIPYITYNELNLGAQVLRTSPIASMNLAV